LALIYLGTYLHYLISKMLKCGLKGLTFGQALMGVQIKPGEGLDLAVAGTAVLLPTTTPPCLRTGTVHTRMCTVHIHNKKSGGT
jgi:hypothetical protein